MERDPMLVDPGEFALTETGLAVPDYIEQQRRKREEICFCGNAATEVFRGWGLCPMCAGPTKRRWRRMNRKQPKMAARIKAKP